MRFMKQAAALLCTAALFAGCSSSNQSDSKSVNSADGPKIGIIQYFEHPALDEATRGFEDYLKENGYEGAQFDFNSAQGELANCTSIAQKLVNDNVNLIFAVGTQAAQSAANETKDIPIVLAAVTNPEGAGLVASNEKPGGNVTGASDLNPVEDQIRLIKEILPDAKKVGLIYCNAEVNSIYQIEMAKKACEDEGLETIEATVTDSNQIQQIVESLNSEVDALYVPTDNLLADNMVTVSQTAAQYGIPCIVGEEGMVKNGGLATYGISYYELGKLAGAQAADILAGKSEPKDMAVQFISADKCTLTLSQKAAEKLNITIPQSVLDRAVVIEEEE